MTKTALGLLAILLIGLKLGGVITWPWLWVLTPLWIGWVLLAMVILSLAAISIFIDVIGK